MNKLTTELLSPFQLKDCEINNVTVEYIYYTLYNEKYRIENIDLESLNKKVKADILIKKYDDNFQLKRNINKMAYEDILNLNNNIMDINNIIDNLNETNMITIEDDKSLNMIMKSSISYYNYINNINENLINFRSVFYLDNSNNYVNINYEKENEYIKIYGTNLRVKKETEILFLLEQINDSKLLNLLIGYDEDINIIIDQYKSFRKEIINLNKTKLITIKHTTRIGKSTKWNEQLQLTTYNLCNDINDILNKNNINNSLNSLINYNIICDQHICDNSQKMFNVLLSGKTKINNDEFLVFKNLKQYIKYYGVLMYVPDKFLKYYSDDTLSYNISDISDISKECDKNYINNLNIINDIIKSNLINNGKNINVINMDKNRSEEVLLLNTSDCHQVNYSLIVLLKSYYKLKIPIESKCIKVDIGEDAVLLMNLIELCCSNFTDVFNITDINIADSNDKIKNSIKECYNSYKKLCNIKFKTQYIKEYTYISQNTFVYAPDKYKDIVFCYIKNSKFERYPYVSINDTIKLFLNPDIKITLVEYLDNITFPSNTDVNLTVLHLINNFLKIPINLID